MKSGLWYFFLFGFQVEVLTEENDDFAKSKIFTFHNGGVQMLCKCSENVQRFRMELLKGTQIICDFSKTKGSGNTVSNQSLKFCQSSNNSVSYFLNNLDSSHDSYYSCRLSIFDPPPFHVKLKSEYLHIYESQLCCQLKFWLPIGCGAFVVVYIFGCTFLCWLKNKKHRSSVHDANSEYMFMAAVNTAKKPGRTGPGVETMIYSASKLRSLEVTAKLRPCCLCSPLAKMSSISLEQPSDLDGMPRVERLPCNQALLPSEADIILGPQGASLHLSLQDL